MRSNKAEREANLRLFHRLLMFHIDFQYASWIVPVDRSRIEAFYRERYGAVAKL